MLILFDFKCTKCDHVHEKLVNRNKRGFKIQDCPKCDGVAERVLSPIRCKLEGHSGDFPGAALKWERQHEKAGKAPSETDPSGW